MSLYTDWAAARSAIVAHVLTAWTITATTNSLERALDPSDLPHARVFTNAPIGITTQTPIHDQAEVVFTVAGVWDRPAGEDDLEDWAMQKAEAIRNAISSDHHLGTAVTEAAVTAINMSLPDLDPNDMRVAVSVEVTCTISFTR